MWFLGLTCIDCESDVWPLVDWELCSRSQCVWGAALGGFPVSSCGPKRSLPPSSSLLWRSFFSFFFLPCPLSQFPSFVCLTSSFSLSLLSSPSSSILFFSVYSILSTLALLCLLPPPPSLPPAVRNCRELAHQEYTNTGFEYFLWWERRVREPLRSSKSVGPSSNQYCLLLHQSWQELPELSIEAGHIQTSEDFFLHLFLSPRQHRPGFRIRRLSSPEQPGAGSMERAGPVEGRIPQT